MKQPEPLDNPVWNALTTAHSSMALSHSRARRYRRDVSPLVGLSEWTKDAIVDLANLVAPEEKVALFTTEALELPPQWQLVRSVWIDQMVCAEPKPVPASEMVQLTRDDVPDMLALTAMTEPGPFLPGTIEMGQYFGIRAGDGRLAAMAGQRLGLNDYVEISAVCTHPDFRGKGYGSALVSTLAKQIREQDKTPFLHVNSENHARFVYQKVGFSKRRSICVTVISSA